MEFIFRRIIFGSPKSVDIIIFDEDGNKILEKVINRKYTFSAFKQSPLIYYIGIKILIKFIMNIKFIFFSKLEDSSRKYFFSKFFKTLKLLYLKSYIELINPKAVITYIDNSVDFHWLSKNCKICPFIAVQNGMRLRYLKDDTKNYYLQHFFCWGENEINLFKQYNYKVENYYPVGSIAAGKYFDFYKNNADNFKFDLLIVSSWRGNINRTQDFYDTMDGMRQMDIFLAKYISIKKIKTAIILRSETNSKNFFIDEFGNEVDYFKKIYKNTAELIENDFFYAPVYKNIQNAKVITSYLSSVLLEAYGIGKKIMYFNCTNYNKYHCDLSPLIFSSTPNWESFKFAMDNILEISNEDYYKIHHENMNKIMSFHSQKNIFNVIQDKIDEIISCNI